MRYVEKHYGEGEGTGERILNPTTNVYMEEGSSCEMEMVQLRGVTSTVRDTNAELGANAKLVLTEKLLTHGNQTAISNMKVELKGEGSSVQVISRSVAQDDSVQVFNPLGIEMCIRDRDRPLMRAAALMRVIHRRRISRFLLRRSRYMY